MTREEALHWFCKGIEATEEGGKSFEQLWCEKQQDQEPDVIRKLSVMLVTLCRTLPKYHELRVGALEYLAEQNLMPSPLRDGGEG